MQCLSGQRSLSLRLPSGLGRSANPLQRYVQHGHSQLRRCRAQGLQPTKPARGGAVSVAASSSNGSGAYPREPKYTDTYTESYRKNLRTVYTVDDWVAHRSPRRYLRHILGLPSSHVLRGMIGPLMYVVGVAAAVCFYGTALQNGLLPSHFPVLDLKNKEIFGLTSFAMSLLLVFRVNTSYERWDSARKMWGQVLNRSRDMVIQGLTWIPKERSQLRAMFLRWVPAFSKALKCHLRRDEDVSKALDGVLLPHEIDAVMKATHRPNYVLQVLAEIVKSARLPNCVNLNMQEAISEFLDSTGGCERILRTPIPLSYSRHTSRFLLLWLTLLPFTLFSSLGWGTVPMCAVVGYLLLGIKEITVTLEEPFSILALEVISDTILSNTRELQAMHDKPAGMINGSAKNGKSSGALSAVDLIAISEPEGVVGAIVEPQMA